jgi:hypothetical protein
MDLSDYPKSVVERQLTKLQKHFLQDYLEQDDDENSYVGTVKPEVMEIVKNHTPLGEILDEDGFSLIIGAIITELKKWVEDTLEGIDANILHIFLIDFVHQLIQSTFTISPSPPPFDPSYV